MKVCNLYYAYDSRGKTASIQNDIGKQCLALPYRDVSVLALSSLLCKGLTGSQASPRGGAEADFEALKTIIETFRQSPSVRIFVPEDIYLHSPFPSCEGFLNP